MSYLTIATPVRNLETAKRVSQAFDPDSGGYEGFDLRATDGANSYAVNGAPCSEAFVQQAYYLKDHPTELMIAVNADPRWPDAVPLTLADCEAFCAGLLMSTAYGVRAGIEELGMVLLTEA